MAEVKKVEIKKTTIELKELRRIAGSIGKIISTSIPNEKIRWRLTKLADLLVNDITKLEKRRDELVKEFGNKDEKGTLITKTIFDGEQNKNIAVMSRENEDEFNRQFEELQTETIEVSFVPMDLTGINAGLTALDMLNLEPFLDEKYIDKLMSDDEPEEVKEPETIPT